MSGGVGQKEGGFSPPIERLLAEDQEAAQAALDLIGDLGRLATVHEQIIQSLRAAVVQTEDRTVTTERRACMARRRRLGELAPYTVNAGPDIFAAAALLSSPMLATSPEDAERIKQRARSLAVAEVDTPVFMADVNLAPHGGVLDTPFALRLEKDDTRDSHASTAVASSVLRTASDGKSADIEVDFSSLGEDDDIGSEGIPLAGVGSRLYIGLEQIATYVRQHMVVEVKTGQPTVEDAQYQAYILQALAGAGLQLAECGFSEGEVQAMAQRHLGLASDCDIPAGRIQVILRALPALFDKAELPTVLRNAVVAGLRSGGYNPSIPVLRRNLEGRAWWLLRFGGAPMVDGSAIGELADEMQREALEQPAEAALPEGSA